MTHISLTKLSSQNPGELVDGYTIKGYCTNDPKIDSPFIVLKYERNGLTILGVFMTTRVILVSSTNYGFIFQTVNSTYELKRL